MRRSTDGGQSWTAFNLNLRDVDSSALAIDPSEPSTIYAGAENGGVYDLRQVANQTVLWLRGGRFKVRVTWRDFEGSIGNGTVAWLPDRGEIGNRPVALRSPDSAVLEFFSRDNWEALVKVLDGRAANGHFWVFLAAATDVAFTATVTDTSCGAVRTYSNAPATAARAVADNMAFPDCPAPAPAACTPSAEVLCLGDGGRFRVDLAWDDNAGQAGSGRQVDIVRAGLAKSQEAGLFAFFDETNWELLVKVLDGCDLNGHFWVFSAAATNVGYDLEVTDTFTGEIRAYSNALGVLAPALNDIQAFATCTAGG